MIRIKNIIPVLIVILMISSGCQGAIKNKEVSNKAGIEKIPIDSLLTLVQYKTFQYFWDGAEPVSGMARERYHEDGIYLQNDKNVVTTGGSGFGIMAIIVGIERGFISREEGLERLIKITDFLNRADRYKGAWSHWMYGENGKTKAFSPKDNGADIVETAFLMQGLLTAKQYFMNGSEKEQLLVEKIDNLWREVNWNWFTNGGQEVLFWHWSPDYDWQMNLQVRAWDECLILYVLAAASPTFPIPPAVYHNGWAREGDILSSQTPYGIELILKHNYAEEYGGPLFWSHYSFLGLDPRNLQDKYAHYWTVNQNHALINREWCIENPMNYKGYGSKCWGLSASYSPIGYAAHAPGEETDRGVISPTAALSAFPYTPEYSREALEYFYYDLGEKLFGKYGFYDAFSIEEDWFPQKYLAIDQGPIIVMIENYRTGLLWDLFMKNEDLQNGLKRLEFTW
jgi:hypothetical protein